ncbi:major facilitator superfamily domain-containing protein [Fimicolochytrium jonesii]|uniref:major facilitator superfamily domain-containing protein n=1 Tax=Fimicolochytrium jonesii TaxID=1396493 RepID=UPI0022FE22B9|nr:major facilitator superfamily domain-containing protein [Fimicolochytrium jonesii]KAI8826023.1 major facilitator superfamily domain-containing protein [Fimicolochytrium jonesii]
MPYSEDSAGTAPLGEHERLSHREPPPSVGRWHPTTGLDMGDVDGPMETSHLLEQERLLDLDKDPPANAYPDSKRIVALISITAGLINFAIAISSQVLDQAIMKRFCDDYYATEGTETTDCTLPAIVGPASEFGSLLVTLVVLPSLITTLIAGHLSDTYGRKKVVMVWMLGMILDCASQMFVLRSKTFGLVVLAAGKFSLGICGGVAVPLMVIVASIADISPADERSRNLGILNGVAMVGMLLGTFIGGAVVKYTSSFELAFAMSTVGAIITSLFYILFVPETKPVDIADPTTTPTAREPLCKRLTNLLLAYKRNLSRIPLLVVFAAIASSTERNVPTFLLPFYTAKVFGWTTWENSVYTMEHSALGAIANVVVLGFVDRWLRRRMSGELEYAPLPAGVGAGNPQEASDGEEVDEEDPRNKIFNMRLALTQVRVYFAFCIVHSLLFAFADRSWMLFAIIPINCIGSLAALQIRNIVFELTPKEAYGMVNSVYDLLLSTSFMAVIKLFSAIFTATAANMPNASFFILAAVGGISMLASMAIRFRYPGRGEVV